MAKLRPDISRRRDKLFALITLLIIISAWLGGYFWQKNRQIVELEKIFHSFENLQEIQPGIYSTYKYDSTFNSFLVFGKSKGYGGPMEILLILDSSAIISQVQITEHYETSSFLDKTIDGGLIKKYSGMQINEDLPVVDAVSGATITSNAIRDAIENGYILAGTELFNIHYEHKRQPAIKFGLPEIVLILLFITGIWMLNNKLRYRKLIFWIAIFVSIIVIGYIKGGLLTVAKTDTYLIGFFPYWQENIYWLLLFAGIILTTIFTGKNIYCSNVCPFGASQECLAWVGKPKLFKRIEFLQWTQRILALIAIVLGLVYRDPGIASYEVFPAMFAFVGSHLLFILLGLTIILSLAIKKPWCNYLCPVGPVVNYLVFVRNWMAKSKNVSRES